MVILEEYYVQKKGPLKFECEKNASGHRPSWIKLKNKDSSIKFLKAVTTSGRFYYHSFLDNYFLPGNATAIEVAAFYNKIAPFYNLSTNHHKLIGDFIYKKLLEHGECDRRQKIISICSGSGTELQTLLKNGFHRITLLDLSKKMINIAKSKKNIKNCRFIVGEFLKYNFKKQKYKIILCNMGIHHFHGKSLQKFIKKVKRISRKRTLVFFLGINLPKRELIDYFMAKESGSVNIKRKSRKKLKLFYFIGRVP